MIKITKKFEKNANQKTADSMEKICDLANDAILTSDDFARACKECSITPGELDGIIDGEVSDMSLKEYNLLSSFLYGLLDECPEDDTDDEECDDTECNCESCECSGDSCCETYNLTPEEEEQLNFIDRINEYLPDELKINHNEALIAKKAFDDDVVKLRQHEYDEAAKKCNKELFGSKDDLSSLPNGELKYLIYKNGWNKEFDMELINNRQSLLSFLYHKLEHAIEKEIHEMHNLQRNSFYEAINNNNYNKDVDYYSSNSIKKIMHDIFFNRNKKYAKK